MIIDNLKTEYPSIEMRVRSVKVNKDKKRVDCIVCVLADVDEQLTNGITNVVRQSVPSNFRVFVSVVKDQPTELETRKFFVDTLKRDFPIVANISKEKVAVSITDNAVSVTVFLGENQLRLLESINFVEEMTERLNNFTSFEVSVELKLDDSVVENGLNEQKKLVALAISRETQKPQRYFSVEDVLQCIGKVIATRPMYISDIRSAKPLCTICGVVGDDKTYAQTKNDPNLYLLKFSLTDKSGGSIECVMFARYKVTDPLKLLMQMGDGKTIADAEKSAERNKAYNNRIATKVMRICKGDSVLVRGKIALSEYSGKYVMQMYDICKCRIADSDVALSTVKPVPSNYLILSPEKIVSFKQETFDSIEKATSFLLRNKTFVVINCNVTGYSHINDRIFAVSCAKIENGAITEKVFAYVNPEITLDDKFLSMCNATHSSFSFSHTLTEIVSDLYKFTYGATLVGMDADKLKPMLNYFALPVGFEFTNEVVFFNNLISDLFDNCTLSKKPNCSNLTDVSKSCHVQYNGSQFCLDKTNAQALCIEYLGRISQS